MCSKSQRGYQRKMGQRIDEPTVASKLASAKAGASSRTPKLSKTCYPLSQITSKSSWIEIWLALNPLTVLKNAGVAVRSNQPAEHQG